MAMNLYQWATQPGEISKCGTSVDTNSSRHWINKNCTTEEQFSMMNREAAAIEHNKNEYILRMFALFVWFATTDRMEG